MEQQTKTIAIHQPYFLPYLGYFQLICQADIFVLLDDVTFIKRGWINRNTILLNQQPFLISLPVEKASQNKLINESYFLLDQRFLEKNLMTIETAYKRAPYFKEIFNLYQQVLLYENRNIPLFIKNSLEQVLNYLSLEKEIKLSHEIDHDKSKKRADKLIDLTGNLQGTHYINSIGGQSLYQPDAFLHHGIKLSFLRPELRPYQQFNHPFVEKLSMLDALMFNSPAAIKHMLLTQFTLI
ncbi:WbqC family protein [Candidatus Odyssella thessalonicensis]|uniref:WbqC family protein n=1 Tax=Candidatus Odyssella thessalonicensis TaxID=84647 RepID=UPI000225C1C6|nr:WbqC family protein [Candidatus Odyssella thessalonicensis]